MTTALDLSLQSGSTRLCRCLRLTRLDGVQMGFTDHDNPLTFDGLTFEASSALSASEASSQLGTAPGELDATGALSSEAISAADLAAGVYDGAVIEDFDVDWSNVSVRQLRGRYTIGQTERGQLAFRAELRSRGAVLDIPKGRVHTTLCDVRAFGDARCGVNVAVWQAAATVVVVSGHEVTVSGLGQPSGFFNRGTVTWTGGPNAGTSADLRASTASGGLTVLSLWQDPGRAPGIGDTLIVAAGCNRSASDCRDRFGNFDNFRGFPHMPGDTYPAEYAVPGDADNTGGSRFE